MLYDTVAKSKSVRCSRYTAAVKAAIVRPTNLVTPAISGTAAGLGLALRLHSARAFDVGCL